MISDLKIRDISGMGTVVGLSSFLYMKNSYYKRAIELNFFYENITVNINAT